MGAFLEGINGAVGGCILPAALFLLGYFFFFRLGCLAPRRGQKREKGAIRALCLSLSGTLGVGNVSGVALAIAVGGAGAVFWMWVSLPAAMALKYAEVTLAAAHQREGKSGVAAYLSRMPGGKVLCPLFFSLCLLTAFFMGSMMQASAAAETLEVFYRIPPALTGAGLLLLTLPFALGGGQRIAAFTEKLVPLLTFLYILISFWVILPQFHRLPSIFARIFSDAFSPLSVGGGILGVLASPALRQGVVRGLVSNEAGCGTAPMAHAAFSRGDPAARGRMGIWEVFVDTGLLCTLTALSILLAFDPIPEGGGIDLAVAAYARGLGTLAVPFLSFSLVFFAWGTALCWVFYAETCAAELLGGGKRGVRLAFCLSLLPGAVFTPSAVWGLSDLFLSLLCLLNLTALFFYRREIFSFSSGAKKEGIRAMGGSRKKSGFRKCGWRSESRHRTPPDGDASPQRPCRSSPR